MFTQAEPLLEKLSAFRYKHVWTPEINLLFTKNTDVLLFAYSVHQDPQFGFTFDSAEKVIKKGGVEFDRLKHRHMFNLAKMTVFDETEELKSYQSMHFEEFLGFLIRLAHSSAASVET